MTIWTVAALLVSLALSVSGGVVTGTFTRPDGAAYTNAVVFRPLSTPGVVGGSVVTTVPIQATATTNGVVTATLLAGRYQVSASGTTAFVIEVPEGTGTNDIPDLVVSGAPVLDTYGWTAIRVDTNGAVVLPTSFWLAASNSVNAVVNVPSVVVGEAPNSVVTLGTNVNGGGLRGENQGGGPYFLGAFGQGGEWGMQDASGNTVTNLDGQPSMLLNRASADGLYVRQTNGYVALQPVAALPTPVLGEALIVPRTNLSGAGLLYMPSPSYPALLFPAITTFDVGGTNIQTFLPTQATPAPVLGEAPIYASSDSAGSARLKIKNASGSFSFAAAETDVATAVNAAAYGLSTANTGVQNAAALTNAINAARRVFVPPGTYNVSSLGIITNSDWVLFGHRGDRPVFVASSAGLLFTQLTNCSVELESLVFAEWRGGICDRYVTVGDGTYYTTNSFDHIKMRDCVWTNIGDCGAIWSWPGGRNTMITTTNQVVSLIDVSECDFYPTATGCGINWAAHCWGEFNVDRCRFFGGSIAAVVGMDDTHASIVRPGESHRNAKITRCHFQDQTTYGLQLMAGSCEVSGNTFRNVWEDTGLVSTHAVYSFTHNSVFSGNLFEDSGINGALYIKGVGHRSGLPSVNNFQNIVAGNRFKLVTRTNGSHLAISSGNLISGNVFYGPRSVVGNGEALYLFTDGSREQEGTTIVDNLFMGSTDTNQTRGSFIRIQLNSGGVFTNLVVARNNFSCLSPSYPSYLVAVELLTDATCIIDGLRLDENVFGRPEPNGGTMHGINFAGTSPATIKNVSLRGNRWLGNGTFAIIQSGTSVENIAVVDNRGTVAAGQSWLTVNGAVTGYRQQWGNDGDQYYPTLWSTEATPKASVSAAPGSLAYDTGGRVYVKMAGLGSTNWATARLSGVDGDVGNASKTLYPQNTYRVAPWATTLTASRTATLSTTGVREGDEFQIHRTGGGLFPLRVSDTAGYSVNIWQHQTADVFYDGSAWQHSGIRDLRPPRQIVQTLGAVSANTNALVLDQGFDDPSKWTQVAGTGQTNWAVTGSKAVCFPGAGAIHYLRQTVGASSGTVAVLATVSAYTAGSMFLICGNVNGPAISAAGTYINALVPTSGTIVDLAALDAGNLSVDDVQVLRVVDQIALPAAVLAYTDQSISVEWIGHTGANGNNKRLYVFATDANTRALLGDSGTITDNAKLWNIKSRLTRGSDATTAHKAHFQIVHDATLATKFTASPTDSLGGTIDLDTAVTLWLLADISGGANGDVVIDNRELWFNNSPTYSR